MYRHSSVNRVGRELGLEVVGAAGPGMLWGLGAVLVVVVCCHTGRPLVLAPNSFVLLLLLL